MKNIIWLASYPKSGNTMLRLFLVSYFFTENGKLKDLNLSNNISIFNDYLVFKKIKNFCNKSEFNKNPELISKYWIEAQKTLFDLYPKNVFFFKTQNDQIKYKNYSFTNNNFTRCFIYIVRDPRSVLVSAKSHYNYGSFDEGLKKLVSEKHLSLKKDQVLPEFLLSWKSHYLSWKKFQKENKNLGLIIRFEDLVKNPYEKFKEIIDLIENKNNLNFNEEKFNNSLKSVNFDKLQKMENQYGFNEKGINAEKFFRKGKIDELKKIVPKEIFVKIEKNFYHEMKELGYI